MDQIEDAPYDLTKVDITVIGADVINGPKLFEFIEDTLGLASSSCGAFCSYLVHLRR
jgi:hypothetical protein